MSNQTPHDLNRRELLAYSAAFGSAFVAAQGLAGYATGQTSSTTVAATQAAGDQPTKRYDMKKSINLWALPYPDKMSLDRCLQLCADAGFDGVELNYALEGDLSPAASDDDIRKIGDRVRELGMRGSGVCSFLFWPYAFTHNDPQRREKGVALAI